MSTSPLDHSPIVYYVTSKYGGVVKIGSTVNMGRRLARLQRRQKVPLWVLASEPGSYDVEAVRHRQFAASNLQGEWFWLTPDLVAHIALLGGVAA